MIILVDMDGPLADFELGFLEAWRRAFPDETYIRLDQRQTPKVRDQYPGYLWERVESIYRQQGFYLSLGPVSGAIEALQTLHDLGHEVLICTSPLSHYENCVPEKFIWVERYLGREFTKRLVLSKDKTLIRGRYLIDDSPSIVGRCKPEWEHVFFDAPYNRTVLGTRRLNWSNWKTALGL